MARGADVLFRRRAAVRIHRVGVALALLAALSCGEEPTGTTAKEFNDKRAELAAKVAEKKQKGAAAEKVAQSHNAAQGGVKHTTASSKPSGPGAFGTIEHDYVYDATGKRDPFRNFKWE